MTTKTRLVGAILVLAITALHVVASEQAEKPKPGVLFKGASIPKPPQQAQPWKPPASSLPEKWITAAEELYRCGFADPRGCEYREVKLTCGSSLWGGIYLVTAHAWVLPDDNEAKPDRQRFAVTWNGIVYPVVEVGPPAQLANDVESLIKEFLAAQNEFTHTGHAIVRGHPEFAERRMRLAPESRLVAHDCMFALKSCLLLRLGEGEFASRVWNTWLAANPDLLSEAHASSSNPYMVLALEWGWALFDHAIAAHLRGDDVVALDTAKTLVLFKESVPRVADQRGVDQRKSLASGKLLDYLPLYDAPETLLEDAARRVKIGPIQRALDVGLEKFPDQSQRISALVRDLEDVSAGPEYKDGEVPLAPPYITYGRPPVDPLKSSPIVQALIKEGEAAVEPLLKCLVDDRRLTRVAGAGHHEISGDLLPPRDLITVDVAAYTALCGILKAKHFGPYSEDPYYNGMSLEKRRTVAEEIRRRFEKIKGLPLEETWLAVLADPEMTYKVWGDAAEKIVARAPQVGSGEGPERKNATAVDGQGQTFEADDALVRPMAGEVLRGRKNPSVTELLIQRSDQSAVPGCEIALCLAKWDPKAAVPVIHRRMTDLRSSMGTNVQERERDFSSLATPMAHLIEAGLQAGEDDLIIRDYVKCLRAMSPGNFPFFELSIFMPLWRHPDNPKLAELARWLFQAYDSPWHPIHEQKHYDAYQMIYSPLAGVPAFRELLKREFNNVSSIGQFEVKPDSVSMGVMNSSMGSGSEYVADVELPKAGVSQPLRACDFYAVEISRLEGAPRYELYWPQQRRDAVRKDMARFLDQWGNCFRDRDKSFESRYSHFSTARFRLPRLSQPATARDVAAGMAIFSLRDRPDAQVRAVPLNPYPHIARWKTLKQFPLQRPSVMEWPKDRTTMDQKVWASLPKEPYDREGLIWQAEEVLQDGKWRRYYGFVGNHVIAKVPAEEIDLLDGFSPAHPHRW